MHLGFLVTTRWDSDYPIQCHIWQHWNQNQFQAFKKVCLPHLLIESDIGKKCWIILASWYGMAERIFFMMFREKIKAKRVKQELPCRQLLSCWPKRSACACKHVVKMTGHFYGGNNITRLGSCARSWRFHKQSWFLWPCLSLYYSSTPSCQNVKFAAIVKSIIFFCTFPLIFHILTKWRKNGVYFALRFLVNTYA